jgi:endonuclease/exonuclease/phosphatase family metal-dependent hydrolase
MKKYFLAGAGAIIIAVALVFSFNSQAQNSANINVSTFTVANYNIENLFDMEPNGTEYPEYIPNFKGWNKKAYETKLENTAKVIKDMGAEIVALEEVENENALKALLAQLKKEGAEYKYYAITSNHKTAVQSALISKFKIISYDELTAGGNYRERPILKARLAIGNDELIIYVNHWKAKTGPESKRIEFANTLTADIKKLPIDADFLVLGDMNSNYNEMETFANNKKLNDTNGVAAINHILKTAKSAPKGKPQMVSKADTMANPNGEYLYNLWMELPKYERVSEWFGRDRNTPDNIIIPKAMFDKKGISYEDESFKVFMPSYLLKNGRPYRWETGGRGKDLSVPQGYSDHLPVLAKFKIGPFASKGDMAPKNAVQKSQDSTSPVKIAKISDLYAMSGNVDILVKDAVVTYKHFDDIVIKQKNGRAIFVYNAPADMELGGMYDIRVGKIEDYHGLKEIKTVIDHKKIGRIGSDEYLLKNAQNLSDTILQNEIVSGISGLVSRGKFLYDNNKEIKIYFKDKTLRPKNLTKITLKSAHIGFYNEQQLVIYQASDFSIAE